MRQRFLLQRIDGVTSIERRLARLEQRVSTADVGQIPLVDLPAWPASDQEAFRLAEETGDQDVLDALVLRHTGLVPGRGPGVRLIVADLHPDCRGRED